MTHLGRPNPMAHERMTIEELQAAVKRLPAEEVRAFAGWLEEFLADEWDRRIEADLLAGKWDEEGRRALEDDAAGRCTPLVP